MAFKGVEQVHSKQDSTSESCRCLTRPVDQLARPTDVILPILSTAENCQWETQNLCPEVLATPATDEPHPFQSPDLGLLSLFFGLESPDLESDFASLLGFLSALAAFL